MTKVCLNVSGCVCGYCMSASTYYELVHILYSNCTHGCLIELIILNLQITVLFFFSFLAHPPLAPPLSFFSFLNVTPSFYFYMPISSTASPPKPLRVFPSATHLAGCRWTNIDELIKLLKPGVQIKPRNLICTLNPPSSARPLKWGLMRGCHLSLAKWENFSHTHNCKGNAPCIKNCHPGFFFPFLYKKMTHATGFNSTTTTKKKHLKNVYRYKDAVRVSTKQMQMLLPPRVNKKKNQKSSIDADNLF